MILRTQGVLGRVTGQEKASHFQVLDCLWQVRQLDVLDLLGNVHIFDRGDRPGRCSCETSLFLLNFILLFYPEHDLCHVGLQHHASHHQLVQNKVNRVHVEDEVKLAHVLEALVQRLHEHLDEVEDAELGLAAVHAEHEVEGGVMPVYQLIVRASDKASSLQKVAHIIVTFRHQLESL